MGEPPCTGLRFSVLGPLSAHTADAAGGHVLPLALGPLKQRLLLAMLLCRPRTPVPLDLLTDTLWDGDPPRTARKNIQVYVSALRRLLDPFGAADRLVHQAGGYLLRVDDEELDALRFQRLVRAARETTYQNDLVQASGMLREALGLWRGPALHDLRSSPALRCEADRLDGRRLQAYESWAETELRLGNSHEVAETIGELVEEHPERERLRAAQMNALFDQGRQTETLAAYEGLRQLLAAEYGLQPSPALQTLYRSMLSGGGGAGGVFGQAGRAGTRPVHRPDRRSATLLPPDLPDFTGRREQLGTLLALLARDDAGPRLAVVTGPAGTGKTALAVHAAHRLADAFPDGRVLIRMRDTAGRARPTVSVLAELAELVGSPAPSIARTVSAAEPDRTAAAWRGWLAGRKVLVVLDGCVDESCVRPLVPDTGASAVLVTARTPLAGLTPAHRLEATAFDTAECLELLGRIVGPARLGAGREAAAHIVTATGMLPLAVRVCGLKLAVRRHLPLDEYARRLADSRTVLDELVAGDMDVRPRLASGWQDLSPADRSALRELSDLPGGPFTLAQAAGRLGRGQHEVLRRLESLMDCGVLLTPDTEITAHAARYELPRLIRVFAREQTALQSPPVTQIPA
ncbi:BTAD domain-containing putative transcriptional regulator [Streptomyces sp. NPDC020707]|uniref:AfsR/SARP family transcriptional regulator n=1 Tax=Streptomyces sp. NPDC020707 TaxID=3365084 RepID=UPI0037892641